MFIFFYEVKLFCCVETSEKAEFYNQSSLGVTTLKQTNSQIKKSHFHTLHWQSTELYETQLAYTI